MRLRTLCAAAASAAAGLLLLVPAASGGAEYTCIDAPPAITFFFYTDPGCGTTTTSYDWGVSPSYSGSYYTDSASADAAEPPPPPPPTTGLPTWRNLYDWPGGHGYAGWHTAASSQAGAYGMQSNLGGQYGLWLWPTGGSAYSYVNGNYAEWTYTAPGTTRLASAQLSFSYRNKLLAHHCIDIGFRTATGTITTHNEHCKPVSPPDSQRQVAVSLVDPAANPTSKILYVRIRVDCGGATSCSKNIPQLDPLSTGGYVRLLKTDMTLVDDDLPTIAPTGAFRDLDGRYINGRGTYGLTLTGQDAGSGIQRVWADRLGAGRLVTGSAPCDPTHKTPALDNRICPPSYSFTSAIDTGPFPEGTNRFNAGAADLAANVGTSPTWTIFIDRTPPTPVSAIRLQDYDFVDQTGTVTWTAGSDPALPDGAPGAGIGSFSYRFNTGSGWTAWATGPDDNFDLTVAPGATFQVEVVEADAALPDGNASAAASVTLVAPKPRTQADFFTPLSVAQALQWAHDHGSQTVQLSSNAGPADDPVTLLYAVTPGTPDEEIVAATADDLFADLAAAGEDVSTSQTTYPSVSSILVEGGSPAAMARSTLVESVASTRRLAASTLGRPAPPACPRPWWPSRGGITTRETDHVLRGGSHIRLVHQWFTWTAANLARMKCDNDVTYEADAAYYRADGGKFLGEELGWMAATNLPSSYLDTRAMDPKCCSVYTIGTDDADKLVAGKRYFTLIRTTQGDATTDTGVPQAQMGYHRFTHCPHFEVMWCVFSRPNGTVNLLDLNPNVQFEHIVPGTDTWTR